MSEFGIPPFVKDMTMETVEEIRASGDMGIGVLNEGEVRTLEEKEKGVTLSRVQQLERGVFLTGQAAGAITSVLPAKEIIEGMVLEAAEQLRAASSFVLAKL